MATNPRCQHPGCHCTIAPEREKANVPYCSDYCQQHAQKDARGGHTHDCQCGHEGCVVPADAGA